MLTGWIESNGMSLEGDAAVGITTPGAIFKVSLDGMAYDGQLRPDLMLPACKEVDFEQCVAVAARYRTVAQPRQFGVAVT